MSEQQSDPTLSDILSVCGSPKQLQTPRGSVEYLDWGEGPVVLALHGAMGGYDQSALLALAALPDGYRCLAVSRPGYLGTPQRSGKSLEQQAELLVSLLDQLGIEQVIVLAISGGGPAALQLAYAYPKRCQSMILISSCFSGEMPKVPFAFYFMSYVLRIPGLAKWVLKRNRVDIEKAAERSIQDPQCRARLLASPPERALFAALITSTTIRFTERIGGTLNDIHNTCHYAYPLREIRAPVLIVHGTADAMVPFAQHAQQGQAQIPSAQLLILEGGEHVALFTHRARIREAIQTFLSASALMD